MRSACLVSIQEFFHALSLLFCLNQAQSWLTGSCRMLPERESRLMRDIHLIQSIRSVQPWLLLFWADSGTCQAVGAGTTQDHQTLVTFDLADLECLMFNPAIIWFHFAYLKSRTHVSATNQSFPMFFISLKLLFLLTIFRDLFGFLLLISKDFSFKLQGCRFQTKVLLFELQAFVFGLNL